MKTALSVSRGRIAPVLDVSCSFIILDGKHREELELAEDIHVKSAQLAEAGVTTLVCGAVSGFAEHVFLARGIKLIPFICGDAEALIAEIESGKVIGEAFLMPGCCGRRNGTGRHLKGRQGLRCGNRNGNGPGRGGRFNR